MKRGRGGGGGCVLRKAKKGKPLRHSQRGRRKRSRKESKLDEILWFSRSYTRRAPRRWGKERERGSKHRQQRRPPASLVLEKKENLGKEQVREMCGGRTYPFIISHPPLGQGGLEINNLGYGDSAGGEDRRQTVGGLGTWKRISDLGWKLQETEPSSLRHLPLLSQNKLAETRRGHPRVKPNPITLPEGTDGVKVGWRKLEKGEHVRMRAGPIQFLPVMPIYPPKINKQTRSRPLI